MHEDTRRDLTVGELAPLGYRLGIYCGDCGRFRYLNAARYRDGEFIRDLAKELKCARCFSRSVEARHVQTDPRTGRWPAEAS